MLESFCAAGKLHAVSFVPGAVTSGGNRQSQESGQETVGGSLLEELIGTLDASCAEVALQGGALPSQQAAQCTSSPDEEKSIVLVSATADYHMTCVTVTHQCLVSATINKAVLCRPDCSALYPLHSWSLHYFCCSLHIAVLIKHDRSL